MWYLRWILVRRCAQTYGIGYRCGRRRMRRRRRWRRRKRRTRRRPCGPSPSSRGPRLFWGPRGCGWPWSLWGWRWSGPPPPPPLPPRCCWAPWGRPRGAGAGPPPSRRGMDSAAGLGEAGRTDGRGGHNAVRMCFSALPFYGGILFYLEAFYFIFFKCCCPGDKLSTAVFKVQFDNGWVDK